MICRYRFELKSGEPVPCGTAYAMYSCLLSFLPEDVAELLHTDGSTPVAQYVWHDRQTGKDFWQVCVLDGTLAEYFMPVLDKLEELSLNRGKLGLKLLDKTQKSPEGLIREAGVTRVSVLRGRVTLDILSPTAFKQNGKYVIMPQEHLILQSLMQKWNSTFPEYPVDDPDAVRMLEDSLHFTDYSLRSTRYPLKDVKIPGFIGAVTMEARLSPPMMEIRNLLICFSEYCGIGIKTALGMGGVRIKQAADHKRYEMIQGYA